jgi:hypothetical protein
MSGGQLVKSAFDKIPTEIYRGDRDPNGFRKLRQTIGKGEVFTNLIDSGIGREIFEIPLRESIKKHIEGEWNRTHFLSFSSKLKIAFKYGTSREDYYEDNDDWDFVIFTLNKNRLIRDSVSEREPGIFYCEYEPCMLINKPKFKILLIDVLVNLRFHKQKGQPNLDSPIQKAKIDKEWLILPITMMRDSSTEFTGKLDQNCFSLIQKFKEC